MITYWGNPRPDGSGGRTFDDPVSIPARWQERQELTYDSKGQQIVSRAVVFVDQDLDVGGYLYNGVSVEEDPTALTGAWEIKNFSKIANMGRTQHERKAVL